ncbi:PLP-dependent aminotransferase family protein [Xanthobacter autotrophicus]|uniref:aminotransferase-like domain-containing protein n=1 Tax=Xanthobacter autotrophicus TaxID=280 RepID=UPI0024A61560|nr:PLP-dependent aminotransferase family protein [Xanthobacter autotrophicus]MDI4655299.1 PLP-dependent aminotransferase family protein [Xanthobacter autotrophicus]
MAGGDRTAPWIRPLDPAGGLRYLQIADLVAEAVATGRLRPGDRLPPQRKLADQLGVDLTTVTRAYAEARRRNLIDAVTGRGSFIAVRREPGGPLMDLSMNIPPAPRGIRLADLMQRGITSVLARADSNLLMSYHVGAGSLADRMAAATWLEPLLGPVDPQRLVVAPGAQSALSALMGSLVGREGVILTEPLAYPGLLAAARHWQVRPVAVATDEDGPLPDALEQAARTHGARLFCLTPTIQNPTAVTVPLARRMALARMAAALGLTIIEDDPYALLAPEAPPPVATLAPERTYYVSTLSKVLTPGLRTAFVVVPSGTAPDALVSALRAHVLMPAPLMTALATDWIRSGEAARLLNGVREEAAARQDLARRLFPSARSHRNGLHLWQPLPAHWDRYRLVEAARREGLGVTASDAFSVEAPAPDAVRISIGGVPDRARLAAALEKLAAIMNAMQARYPDDVV